GSPKPSWWRSPRICLVIGNWMEVTKMSRIGKKPVVIPDGVEVSVKENQVTVKGPKGTLARSFNKGLSIKVEDNQVIVSRPNDNRQYRALHGTTRSLISNMVEGVSK